MWNKLKPYLISILFAHGTGALAALLTSQNISIYTQIPKPPLAPPGYLFPIVWSILYTLMGYSAARIYVKQKEAPDDVTQALYIYSIQLLLNFIWSFLFFNLQNFLLAFIWLVILWIAILIMIIRFWKVDYIAALLQIPYLLWVTFAGYLNLMIYLISSFK